MACSAGPRLPSGPGFQEQGSVTLPALGAWPWGWIPLYVQLSRAAVHRNQVSGPNHKQNCAADCAWAFQRLFTFWSRHGPHSVPPRGRGEGHSAAVLDPPPPALPPCSNFLSRGSQKLPVLSGCLSSFLIYLSTSCSRCLDCFCAEKGRQAGSKQRASGIVQRCAVEGTAAQLGGAQLGSGGAGGERPPSS